MTDEIEVLVEFLDKNNVRQSVVLGRGDQFGVEHTPQTIERVEVRPAEDEEIKADGGTERVGHSDERWEREVREKKERGQGGLDESQTVADAAQPDETVADRLRQARDCWPLLKALTGRKDPEELTYEDWVRPLKLTGGKVCLKVYHDTDNPGYVPCWLRRRSDGMIDVAGEAADDDPLPPKTVKTMLRLLEVEPVLVEDTPFGEDDDTA